MGDDAGGIGGRYELARLLKHSRGVETHLASDRETGAAVVVKIIDTDAVPAATRLRLEHEAEVLRRLAEPALASLIDSRAVDGRFYLVQPFHEGETLRVRIAEHGPLSLRPALRVAEGVLAALEAAHDAGVLHRDVKPENVIVDGDGAALTVHLVDFGFAHSISLDPALQGEPVGTARYLAPEAAGLIDGGIDARTDLYSVGVVVFEALAGRPPYSGETVGEVLRQHLNVPIPHLRAIGVDVPRAVDGVVQRLLAKEPAERYQSASAALADVRAIHAALGRGVADPPITPGSHDVRAVLTEPAFVGRAEELDAIATVLDRAHGPDRRLILVEADSGGGKTRLLEELVVQVASRGWSVYLGQGVDQAARRPFEVLDGVASGVVAACGDDPGRAEALRSALGARADAAVAALPELVPLLGHVDAELGPEAFGETRNLDALAALLDALGDDERPALVILDDCQWADSLTVRLLAQWRRRRTRSARVCVIGAFRSEEVAPRHPLRDLPADLHLRLAPFNHDDVRSLCRSMAGPLPDDAVSTVARLADGSPFMAAALLRGMVEIGALLPAPQGWAVDPTVMGEVQTSRRAAIVLARRFDLLAEPTLALLSVGAVLGKEFDLDLAVELGGHDAAGVAAALEEARARRILWIDEATGRCSFTHDKLREGLLERIAADERAALHLRAGERIEQLDPERVYELAYHFDAGGAPGRALPYALAAAERARERHALEVAATHYRIGLGSLASVGDEDPELRARLAEGLGDVLTLQGGYDEAQRYFDVALTDAASATQRAALGGKLGDLSFKRGDQAGARAHLEGALRDLGRFVPGSSLGYALAAVFEIVVQALHTILPRLFVGRRSLDRAEDELLAVRMYSRLAYVFWFHAGKVPCAWSHLREMNLVERYPPTPERAQAYSEHAPVMTMAPWYRRGNEYARRSYEIRRDLGDLWGQGQSLGFHGVVLYAGSRYAEAIERCREAIRLLERTGDRWEQHTAMWHLAYAHYRLGDLGTATDLAREIHGSASAIGDMAATGISLSVWAKASAGAVPAELIAAELARDNGDAHTTTELLVADGIRLLRAGRTAEAIARLESAQAVVRGAGLRQEYVAPVLPWLATALRIRIEQTAGHAPRPVLRRARRVARRAARQSRAYRNNLPHALRERALLAHLSGSPQRARRLLARSAAVAQAQGARYEEALTALATARLDAAALGADTPDLERCRAAVAALEGGHQLDEEAGTSALSAADRFDTLLRVGRSIASATSPAAVYEAVREASLQLFRGERCHVIEIDERFGSSLVTESGNHVDPLSISLVDRAVREGRTVVSDEVLAASSSESVELSDLRSVLCAPVRCDDRVVACFYTTHQLVGHLFAEEEVQLADFVATLAGAALEHVAGTEARFRSLAQRSSDVITIVRRDGIITYQSSAIERVFGYTTAELVGTAVVDLVHPDDVHLLEAVLESTDGGDAAVLEFRVRHRDGGWRHVETAVTSMFDDPGVSGAVLNTRDISERVSLEAELRQRAWHDSLTGLANRALFMDRVEHAIARRQREHRPLAVAFLDVDEFKSVNDSKGHPAGDLLLREVAARLQSCVRPGDTVARFGGDEFAVLLENADEEDAIAVGRRILTALELPLRIAGSELPVRASVGLAVAAPADGADDLVSAADTAMYVAKARGKARVEVFEPAMRAAVVERSSVRADLEFALQREELRIHYQPVVDVITGELRGFEALLRWEHPDRGLLVPGEFIDLAEETGLIVPIGAWVLREAAGQIEAWHRLHGPELSIAVNVSARQLQDPGLVGKLALALQESRLDPGALILEITESATVGDTEAVITRLHELKGLGVGLAIDDFGTGYSSLSYLRRFPVDQLKVDRTFVAGLVDNEEDEAIVASVINLAHALGVEVVAEGVETVEHLERLGEMGCDLAQGYNWPEPAAAAVVTAWLESFPGSHPPSPSPTRVVVVDDRAAVRAAVRIALEVADGFEVVGEAGTVAEALRLVRRTQPDLVVLDVALPDGSGLELVPRLRVASPGTVVVVLTALSLDGIAEGGGEQADRVLDKATDLGRLAEQLAAAVGTAPPG